MTRLPSRVGKIVRTATGADYCYATASQSTASSTKHHGIGNTGLPSARRQYETFSRWGALPLPDRHGGGGGAGSGTGGKAMAKKDLEHLLELLEQGRVNPEVLERIPLSKVGKAQFILEHKCLTGHLVCTPWRKQPPPATLPSPSMMGGSGGGTIENGMG
jgi:hypothetical protein